jgi:hypothetical protein
MNVCGRSRPKIIIIISMSVSLWRWVWNSIYRFLVLGLKLSMICTAVCPWHKSTLIERTTSKIRELSVKMLIRHKRCVFYLHFLTANQIVVVVLVKWTYPWKKQIIYSCCIICLEMFRNSSPSSNVTHVDGYSGQQDIQNVISDLQ